MLHFVHKKVFNVKVLKSAGGNASVYHVVDLGEHISFVSPGRSAELSECGTPYGKKGDAEFIFWPLKDWFAQKNWRKQKNGRGAKDLLECGVVHLGEYAWCHKKRWKGCREGKWMIQKKLRWHAN